MNVKQQLIYDLIGMLNREIEEELPGRTNDFYEKQAIFTLKDLIPGVIKIRKEERKRHHKQTSKLVKEMFSR